MEDTMRNNYCVQCNFFTGGGDFGLCCTQKYELCYENSLACELFAPCSKDTLEKRKQSFNYINCYKKIFEKEGIEI